jgi:transcriptional regulator with XRE-family HTH domain
MPERQSFAATLQALRERRGLSQTDVAKLTGLEPSAISHFETGRRAPSWKNLPKLADALECSVDALYAREGVSAVSPLAEAVLISMSRMKREDQVTLAGIADLMADGKKLIIKNELTL